MLQILRYNSRHLRCHHASLLRSSRRSDDRFEDDNLNQQQPQQKHQPALKLPQPDDPEMASSKSIANPIMRAYQDAVQKYRRPPPRVEDVNVLLYDIVLILNLSVSISFWVIHRMEFSWIGTAFNEGCLLSILWIVSGLWTGAFLNSAVDGHFGSLSEEGGHLAAARLAFHTFLNAINLRLVVALCMAIVQHRPVGIAAGEQLMPLELAFGLGLMIFWRAIHSSIVPRF